jgi:glycosyltransferase involved in cell wall biosynthesis
MPLPISAILPIYNCRERLERHLNNVVTWASEVQEIIVVDSGSLDGSLEVAKEILSPLGANFLHHPPGLYQSWNAGIAAATSPCCYISTVEDPVLPGGLAHLCEVARRIDADVVISPPEMRSEDGSQTAERLMPGVLLEKSLAQAGFREDRILTRTEILALMCGFSPCGLLGSSASNLYKTSFLQKNPFPTDYGMAGDTAWGITVSPFVKAAFTPVKCAQFYCQTKWGKKTARDEFLLIRKLEDLASSTLAAHSLDSPEIVVMSGWHAFHLYHFRGYYDRILKYEGGIIPYLGRAFRDELKKLFGRP